MKNGTTILISHRVSTLKNADRIVVRERAAIAETGTHEARSSSRKVFMLIFTSSLKKN
jgi:ABC-type multidrug transport system fused ATPase/permease subunit